jgi:hypothetical protein
MLPTGIPSFMDVILVTLYVIGCSLSGGFTMNDFLEFFYSSKFLIRALAWYDMRCRPPDPSNKNQRHVNRANRKLV